jgi:hypothetical protein
MLGMLRFAVTELVLMAVVLFGLSLPVCVLLTAFTINSTDEDGLTIDKKGPRFRTTRALDRPDVRGTGGTYGPLDVWRRRVGVRRRGR